MTVDREALKKLLDEYHSAMDEMTEITDEEIADAECKMINALPELLADLEKAETRARTTTDAERAEQARLILERDQARADCAKLREELARCRDRALEVENASREYFGFWGGKHDVGCPEDDTCECEPLTRFCDALTALDGALKSGEGK